MNNSLFLMNGKKATEMQIKTYEKEADLQEIIKDNPNLLARPMEDGKYKKLYLIKQEYSIKELEYGSISYSLDHFMVDDEGIPVLVEVKRSTDTRIKREVVAQMLDYASRVSKWDVDEFRQEFEIVNPDFNPNSVLFNEKDEFWAAVSTNLAAEHFRLVFVADEIPDSLRVLIEFLDRSMKNIEVYGVEIKPYKTEDGALLLSRNIIGNSILDSKKPTSSGMKTICKRTIDEFREVFRELGLGEFVTIFDRIYSSGEEAGISWVSGIGEKNPSYLAKVGDQTIFRIAMWPARGGYRALAEIRISDVSKLLNEKEDKEQVRERLIGFKDKKDLLQKGHLGCSDSVQTVFFDALKTPENLELFINAMKQIVEDIQRENQ